MACEQNTSFCPFRDENLRIEYEAIRSLKMKGRQSTTVYADIFIYNVKQVGVMAANVKAHRF